MIYLSTVLPLGVIYLYSYFKEFYVKKEDVTFFGFNVIII